MEKKTASDKSKGTEEGKGDAPVVYNKTIKVPKSSSPSADATVSMLLGEDGALRLVASNAEKKVVTQLWTSTTKCPTASSTTTSSAKSPLLRLNRKTGIPEIICGDGTTLAV